jgi:hypothetical protein
MRLRLSRLATTETLAIIRLLLSRPVTTEALAITVAIAATGTALTIGAITGGDTVTRLTTCSPTRCRKL